MSIGLPGILSQLTEFLQPLPKRYDPHTIRAVIPDPAKEKTLAGHIRECHARYVELRVEMQDARIEQARTMRLLWVLIALAVGGNAGALQQVAAFILN